MLSELQVIHFKVHLLQVTSWSSSRSSRAGFNPVPAGGGSKGSVMGTVDRRFSPSLLQMYKHQGQQPQQITDLFLEGKNCFIVIGTVQSSPVLCQGHNHDWAEIRHSTADWLFSLLEPPGFLPCSPHG